MTQCQALHHVAACLFLLCLASILLPTGATTHQRFNWKLIKLDRLGLSLHFPALVPIMHPTVVLVLQVSWQFPNAR